MGVFVLEPRQQLNDPERHRRLDEATQRFVNAVVSLGFEPEEILDHLAEELACLSATDKSTDRSP